MSEVANEDTQRYTKQSFPKIPLKR